MPELTVNELRDLVHEQHNKLREYEARQTSVAIDTAISQALDSSGHEFASGAARSQLVRILKDETVAHVVGDQTIVGSRSGGSVPDLVRSKLQSGEFQHFLRSGKTQQIHGAAGNPAQPASGGGGGWTGLGSMQVQFAHALSAPHDGQVYESEGHRIATAIVGRQQAHEAAHGDSRYDISQPLGLRRIS